MLEKFILHLKNIIFFQVVICSFCILLLIWLIRAFNQEYINAKIEQQTSQQILTEETLKLYSVVNSQEEILQAYKKYSDFIDSSDQSCGNYFLLINHIKALAVKYALSEPIEVKIQKFFLKNNFLDAQVNRDKIKIENYDVNLKFATKDFATFFKILKDSYSYISPNTIITYLKVRNQYVLEPEMIYKLSTLHPPDLIFTKLNMRTRKLIAKQ